MCEYLAKKLASCYLLLAMKRLDSLHLHVSLADVHQSVTFLMLNLESFGSCLENSACQKIAIEIRVSST